MLCLMGGCLQETPLTDHEMDVVAEYAADMLLRYDANNISQNVFYDEEKMEALVNPTSTPTPEPTATPTPIPDKEQSSSGGAGGFAGEEAMPTVTPIPENSEETNVQLTAVLGAQEGIRISYKGYEITDNVVSSNYLSLSAKEGRTYVVVSLEVHNDTDQELVFNASESKMEYLLDVNLGTVSKSALAMLENGLQYFPITVPAEGVTDAVLVFDIADVEISTAHLIIRNENDETVFVKLK